MKTNTYLNPVYTGSFPDPFVLKYCGEYWAYCTGILVDGRCLMMSEYGHLVWLDLNPKAYKELERTRLFLARENWSMPALSRGLLYVCQNTRGFDV